MDTMFVEPWNNSACLGYVISALENLGYEQEKITEIVMESKELFDWLSIEDAEEVYNDSEYC